MILLNIEFHANHRICLNFPGIHLHDLNVVLASIESNHHRVSVAGFIRIKTYTDTYCVIAKIHVCMMIIMIAIWPNDNDDYAHSVL